MPEFIKAKPVNPGYRPSLTELHRLAAPTIVRVVESQCALSLPLTEEERTTFCA
jgi:hypothetical protein